MNIYKSLKDDHEEVKGMLAKLAKHMDDYDLFNQLIQELEVHDKAEEKTFYEPLKKRVKELDVVFDVSKKEHNGASALMQQYANVDMDIRERKILFSLIKESIEAHIEKEEKEIFKLAKSYFSDSDAKEIGENFLKEKENLKNAKGNEDTDFIDESPEDF